MKKFLKILSAAALVVFLSVSSVHAAPSVLTVPQGGTGTAVVTGLLKGNGTSAISTAVPNTDYLTPTGSGAGLTGIPSLTGPNSFSGQNTFTNGNQTNIGNLDTVLYADQFPGADIGAKNNAAYAALPSTGGEIIEPSGQFAYTTPMVLGTNNKLVTIFCPSGGGASNNAVGGTVFDYTPSTGDALTLNTNNYAGTGDVINNCDFEGSNGTSARTTNGITLGGTNGAFSATLNNVNISGFGTGLHLFQNTSFITVNNTAIHFNGRNIFIESTSGANGENFKMIGGLVADSNNQAGGPTEDFCINNQLSGNTQVSFEGTSIDDCGYYANQSGGTSNNTNFTDVHWENPNGQAYDYIKGITSSPSVVINLKGGDMMNDDTSGLTEYVTNGGSINFIGTVFDSNNTVSTPVTNVVTNLGSTNAYQISWNGVSQKGAGVTHIYGTVPFSPQGTGDATTQGVSLNAAQFPGGDMCAQINAAYTAEGQTGQTGGIIIVPKGKYTCTTPIVFGVAGQRVLLQGTPAGGTEIDYNGSASTNAITINTGIQASGIDHTTGNGIDGISLYCNATTTTNPKVGVFVGGTNGTDGAVVNATNIYGCGRGLVIGANAYHFLYSNGTIRNNGQNVYISPASNSGESIDFLNAFIVDGASNTATDCFYDDNSGTASLNYTGGSLDDCQTHILQADDVTFTGVHFENPGFSAWGSYVYIVIDNNLATNVDINGSTFYNDAPSGTSPSTFITNGGNTILQGDIVRQFGGFTVTNFETLAGTGRVTWVGLNNVSGTAFTNVVSTAVYTPNGFATQAGAVESIDNNGILTTPAIKDTATQTTVSNSTSGTTIFSEPMQGSSYKVVTIYENAALGTASYTFPTAFSHAPQVISQSNAGTATTVSTTAVTITGSTTTGFVELNGF